MKNTLALLSLSRAQRQGIGINLTLLFLNLSDEPSPPPSPSLLSSAVAVSAMLSSVFPSMMGGVRGRGGVWGVGLQPTEMGENSFFFSAKHRAFMEPSEKEQRS
jgi:hypothetical protein